MRDLFPLRSILRWLLCLLVLTGCNHVKKNSPADAVDAFFVFLEKGKAREAFEGTAFAFQAQINAQNFEATTKDFGLEDYVQRTWSVRSLTKKEAILDGGIVTKSDVKFRIEATLIKESGRWKLCALRTPGPDGSGRLEDRFTRIGRGAEFRETFTRAVPGDKEVRALLAGTMKKFNDGLHKKNFTEFYNAISLNWQSQTSKSEMERAFKSLLESNITIDTIETVSPVFDPPPRLNADGMLLLKGSYPAQPHPVSFVLKYTYELPQWRLISITITIR